METEQIQARISELEKNQTELKTAKDAIKDALESDLEYVKACEEAKKANQKKKQLKESILNNKENQKFAEEIRTNTQDQNVLIEILSAELLDFYQKSNKEEVVDSNGEVRKFKVVAKLLPKNSNENNRNSHGKFKENA